jgi:hypothetical protein
LELRGLRAEPSRLQLVHAGPLRLREFARAFPSSVPLRTVAAINGLDPDDPDAVVPGAAKRVVHLGAR